MATADTRPFWRALREDVRALGGSPRELWILFGVKFLESVAYFALTNLLILYLSEDLGYGDVEAGDIYGTWTTAISVMTFFAGIVADAIGIRTALSVSVASCLIGRAILGFTTDHTLVIVGLAVSAWGTASMLPTMIAAVRRYTGKDTVAFGYSFFYVVMNIGAFVAPITIGALRRFFPRPVALDVPLLGAVHWSSSQLMFLVAAGATLLAMVLVLTLRADASVPTAGEIEAPVPKRNPLALVWQLGRERAFWGFMLFVTLLVFVKLIFQHAHQTWPKYTLREFGPDFDFAWYWSINPFMIMLFTAPMTALTRRYSAFWCIVVGAVVTAGSVFFMAASTSVWASVAFIVTLSIGEMLWSPRLYEYTATIAPKGREASYMGLSSLPLFFAKMQVALMSGRLLAAYCPETGERSSRTMWIIIGLVTLLGPALIVLLRRVIEPRRPEAGPPPEARAA
jgi:dipeptide/tripeptide permease